MGLVLVVCQSCRRKMNVAEGNTKRARDGPYVCSRKSCRNKKG